MQPAARLLLDQNVHTACQPARRLLLRQVTFYMRKGADLLSKWVGEAEKQLRLLFEEAQRHQPAIIFFDEIDGLAPVRRPRLRACMRRAYALLVHALVRVTCDAAYECTACAPTAAGTRATRLRALHDRCAAAGRTRCTTAS